MGLAMGLDRAQLGLEKLVVSPFPLMAGTIDAPDEGREKPKKVREAKPKRWGEA
jgi:hypothetical protein